MRFPRFTVAGAEPRPAWWQVRPSEIIDACASVRRGRSEIIAETPGGLPVYAVFYGDFADPPMRTNWSAGSASRKEGVYGAKADSRPTLIWCAGIHGAEAEAVAASVNLISLFETGKDLRGMARPKLMELLDEYRVIVLPCVNMDGRAISPDHLRQASYEEFRKASQGVWEDGSLVDWLGSKEHFPLPLDQVAFPGGYPNADGFNIMHDACPGHVRTAEARAVLRLAERYAADVVVNAHSCEGEPVMLSPSNINYPRHIERGLRACDSVNDALLAAGLRRSPVSRAKVATGVNLNTLLMLASGAFALTLECTVSHGLTFDQLMEVNFVTLEALLESGRTDPLMDRNALMR